MTTHILPKAEIQQNQSSPFTLLIKHSFILRSWDVSHFQSSLGGNLEDPFRWFPKPPTIVITLTQHSSPDREILKTCRSITWLFTSRRTHTLIIQKWGGGILFIHQKRVGVEHNSAIFLAWRETRPCNANEALCCLSFRKLCRAVPASSGLMLHLHTFSANVVSS